MLEGPNEQVRFTFNDEHEYGSRHRRSPETVGLPTAANSRAPFEEAKSRYNSVHERANRIKEYTTEKRKENETWKNNICYEEDLETYRAISNIQAESENFDPWRSGENKNFQSYN